MALRLASVTELRRFQNKMWAVVLELAIVELALHFCRFLNVVRLVAVAVHWLKALCVLHSPLLVTFVQILLVTQSCVWSSLHLFEGSYC